MVRYSFLVGLLHSLLHAGLSRRSDRRLAYEASDSGLLSADLAAGIRRVKGVKKIGVRLRNWLLPDQAVALLEAPNSETMKGKRDVAIGDTRRLRPATARGH